METYIGIVGTEAKINQKELVKIRRKIWSIPIAVLALVLMLAGALAVSGIVQAQAANIVKGGGDVILGSVTDGTAITTITVAEASLPEADPVVRGVDDDEAIVAVLLTGRDAALFEVLLAGAGGGVAPGIGNAYTGGVASRSDYDHDGDGITGEGVTIGVSAAEIINDEETKAVYTFNVVVWFDTNTEVDSGKGYRPPVMAGQTAAADQPDVPTGELATPTDKSDDRDSSQAVTVTLYIPKVIKDPPAVDLLPAADDTATPPTRAGNGVDDFEDDLFFAAIPGMASQDDVFYGTSGQSKAIRLAGLASNSKVISVGEATAEDGAAGPDSVYSVVNGQIKYGPPPTGEGYFGVDGADDLPDFGRVSFALVIDSDVKTDATTGDGSGDTVPDNDEEITVVVQANIKLYEVLSLARSTVDIDTTDRDETQNPHEFTVRSAASADAQVGVIGIIGARDDETIDIISNSANFDVGPRRVGGSDMQAVITVREDADLASLIGSSETFTVTANGSLVATRTDAVKVTVSVTASNEKPDIIDPNYDSTDEVLPINYGNYPLDDPKCCRVRHS